MSRKNSLLRAFTFNDLLDDDDEDESGLSQDDNNQNELDLFSKQNSQKSFKSMKSKELPYKKNLTKGSKFELTLRIILYSLIIIFIPLSYMVKTSFDEIEKDYIFRNMKDLATNDQLKQRENNIFFYYRIIHDKDFLLGVSMMLYMILHPFIAIKIIFSSSFFYFIINVIKCFSQPKRPLWEIMNFSDINDIVDCETSFSNPCEEICFISLYYLYTMFCIRAFYFKYKRMSWVIKIFTLIIYLGLIFLEYYFLLIYKLNYLHEITFSNMLILVFICILIDFDDKYQKKLFDSTKNLFKTRKNKIKILFFVFALFSISILIYNFILPNKILFETIEKLSHNDSCSKEQKENFGMKMTLLYMPYIFAILGSFWGACLTLEFNPGEWWYQPLIINTEEMEQYIKDNDDLNVDKIKPSEVIFLIIKSILTFGVYFAVWMAFNQIPFITFESNLMIGCIKYFFLTFICCGILPILFGLLHMNKKFVDIFENPNDELFKNEKWHKNLFVMSLFANYQEKAKYSFIYLKKN